MSEEQKQSVDGKECGSICSNGDDGQFEIVEGGSERLDSNLTSGVRPNDDLEGNSEQDLGYIDGGLEIQEADVMIIQRDKMCFKSNSEDSLETAVYCQYPTDSDEDYCSPLPQDYFDDLRAEQGPEAFISPVPNQVHVNGTTYSANTPREEKLDRGSLETDASERAGASETCPGAGFNGGQGLESTESLDPEILYKTGQVIEVHQTPLYEFTHLKPKSDLDFMPGNYKQNLGNLEYNSDEFADIEDNSMDSPPENYEFLKIPSRPNVQWNGSYMAKKLYEESVDGIFGCKKALSKECPRSDEVIVPEPENSFPEPCCSYSSLRGGKIPEASKNTEKKTMDTIVEVPECEIGNGSAEFVEPPPVSKTRPLKMKSSVGNKKNKCNVCRVRLGLCAIRCRCGGYYCAKHRYDREHNCTFDYRSMGAEEIRKNNPQVVAEKVRKL